MRVRKYIYVCAYTCVCVCVREREREREIKTCLIRLLTKFALVKDASVFQ